MTPDLKKMSRKELEKLRSSVERAGYTRQKAALAAAKKAAAAHGFSLAELTGIEAQAPNRKATTKPKNPGVAKYKNPNDATQTWTGKGRRPDWFLAAIEKGSTPDDLEI